MQVVRDHQVMLDNDVDAIDLERVIREVPKELTNDRYDDLESSYFLMMIFTR